MSVLSSGLRIGNSSTWQACVLASVPEALILTAPSPACRPYLYTTTAFAALTTPFLAVKAALYHRPAFQSPIVVLFVSVLTFGVLHMLAAFKVSERASRRWSMGLPTQGSAWEVGAAALLEAATAYYILSYDTAQPA